MKSFSSFRKHFIDFVSELCYCGKKNITSFPYAKGLISLVCYLNSFFRDCKIVKSPHFLPNSARDNFPKRTLMASYARNESRSSRLDVQGKRVVISQV